MPLNIEFNEISKRFPGVVANDSVSMRITPGKIYGIIGENGAGKTTLMNILYGLYQPDGGNIRVNEQTVRITNPRAAIDIGIGMVHQHFMLIPSFTVLENIVLGMPTSGLFLDLKAAEKKLRDLSSNYHLECEPEAKVHSLSVGKRQKVEILKALYRGSELLILDEPASVLTPQEVNELFVILKSLKEEGKTVVLVTHKLGEIMSITDKVFVMKRGKLVGEIDTEKTDEASLAKMMVGRDVMFKMTKDAIDQAEVALSVEDCKIENDRGTTAVDGVSFNIRGGEILGIAGVEGNGQTELLECLAGLRPPLEGKIQMFGHDVTGLNPRQRRERNLAHIPEDRMSRGIAEDANVKDNIIAGQHYLPPLATRLFLNVRAIRERCKNLIKKYFITTPSHETKISDLSGGNIQKLIIAREMDSRPKLLLVVNPSRGLDIGATEFIHEKILTLRRQGAALLLISSELSEVMSLSDRILVMYKGQFNGECIPDMVTEEDLGILMAGAKGI